MPDPVPIEDLLAHRDFLHRLAAGIVRNDATADDLVQDTWLDALHRPPRSRLNLRQWLAVIVTRKAYRERVRALREAAAPWDRAEVTAESAGECAAHGSLSERIAGSVLACREPYRSVLLLRFYEGLPPREIAARTALSIHTVNSRLQRALALVRADLSAGEEGPPERLPLLLLAAAPRRDGPQAHPAAATRGRPVARPRSAWRLAGLVAAAAAVVAIPVFLRPGPRGRGASLGVAAPQHAGGAASEALVAARAAEPPGRVPVALDLAAGRALDAPAEQLGTLSVRVVDRDGAPLRGALVWMMALGLDRDDEPASREAGRTDAAGRLAVALVPADVGDIFGRRTVGVWAGADDRAASRACYAPLADALERELVLATRGPAWELRGRVLGCREPLAGAVVAVGSGGWESDGSVMTWDRPQRLRTDASGRFAVDLPPGRHRVAVTAPGYAPFITHPDSRSGKGELALHLELGASVSGVVRDTDGVPVAGAEVFAGREYDEPSWETRTAADGSFELAGLPAGARYLYARVDDRPQFVRSVMELTPGKNELWDCRLRPEPPLEIRLVDEEQQPLAGHVVHLSADARAPWLRALTTDEDGRATTFGPPPGPWRAVIHRPAQLGHGRADEPHSIVEFAGRETGPTTIRVPAEPECRGTLEATVLTRAGTAPQGANLRLVGGDLWLDRKIPIDAADGHARLEHVPAGSYLLCVGWRDHPTVVLRRCTLAADDALDLGSIALPESATLVLDRALPAGLTLELAQNLDGRREVVARTSNPPPFELPPGSFEVVLRSARGILHREAISLGAGDRVSWSVPDAVRKRD